MFQLVHRLFSKYLHSCGGVKRLPGSKSLGLFFGGWWRRAWSALEPDHHGSRAASQSCRYASGYCH